MSSTKTPRHSHLVAPERVKDFITGGKSIFTVLNTATGNRGTFRVEKLEDSERDYEVRAFTGSDNSKKSEYTLLGWVRKDGSFFRYSQAGEFLDLQAKIQEKEPGSWLLDFLENWAKFLRAGRKPTPKMQERYGKSLRKFGVPACLPPTEKGDLLEKMFAWTWDRAHKGLLPQSIEVWHEGACCYCAKRLTVPASIELGMGPDCAQERGFYPLWLQINTNPGTGLPAAA